MTAILLSLIHIYGLEFVVILLHFLVQAFLALLQSCLLYTSNFDIPLMLGYLPKPCGVLAKKELEKVPFIRSWMKLLHCCLLYTSRCV